MIPVGSRPQRTLAQSVEISGVGFITGSPVRCRLLPAPANTGRLFHRTDLRGATPIAARVDAVTGTARRTTIGSGANQVTLVEHLLAALSGMRIDNCLIEIDGPEPPGLDGSALEFVQGIIDAGVVLQTTPCTIWTVANAITLKNGGCTLSIYPSRDGELQISYLLDYGPRSPIAPQTHTETILPDHFHRQLAGCRTFVLEEEARELQANGIGSHLTAAELLVFSSRGLIDNTLRFANEPARHKVLDIVGDLALAGMELAGSIVAYRSGHPLNVEMARMIQCEFASRQPRRVASDRCVA